MLRIIRGVLTTCICLLGISAAAWASTYPTATVTITQSGIPTSGTVTIAFNTYSETIPYGPLSTANSIASQFAAIFSVSQPGVHPCMQGVCAKAIGSTIKFQLNGANSFGPISFTGSASNPFVASATSISLTSTNNTSVYGQAVTFTATASFTSAQTGSAGTVTFYDGANLIGSYQVSDAGNTINLPLTVANLSAGQHAITAVLSNSGLPNVISQTVGLQVTQATPVITWAIPAAINSGTALSSLQLNATTNVSGIYVYTPASGTVLASGNWPLSVVFIPNDTTDYKVAVPTITTLVVNGVQVSNLAGIINTVAGNGLQGFTGDGGPATAAELEGPIIGLSVDAANNVYFCDGISRVRKVTAATGIITTVAGDGTPGYSGDNQPAKSAEISCNAMAVDAAGDVYIGDVNDERIRKVSFATGIITTVAGNGTTGYSGDGNLGTDAAIELYSPPTSTEPATPLEIGVDAVGNLYFYNADEGGVPQEYDVRTVSASTGFISTYANGELGLGASSNLEYFAVDPSGNIYLLPLWDNGSIYKVSSSSGNSISVAAGIFSHPGNTGDGGQAIDAEVNPMRGTTDTSGNLFFNEVDDYDIREINNTSGFINLVGSRGGPGEGCPQQTDSIGDGCSSIDAPPDSYNKTVLAVDSNDNIYTADALYVRVISASSPTQVQPSTISVSCSSIPYGTDAVCNISVSAGVTGTISLAYPSINGNDFAYTPAQSITSGSISQIIPTSNLKIGNYSVFAIFNSSSTSAGSMATTNLAIYQATPTFTWPMPGSISYGTPLGSQQLNASTSVSGVITYTPGFDAVLPIGLNTLSLSFTPTDSTNYMSPVTVTQTLMVTGATPTVSWPPPASIQYGTALSWTQLNATADVPGTFLYTDSSGHTISVGTILPIGLNTLLVSFTPTNSNNNTSNVTVTASVQIEVNASTPNITSIMPSPAEVGVPVTIVGQNFGLSQGSSTVTFNGVAATITSWTDNSIVTAVPVRATTGNVVVNVNTIPSNNFLLMIPASCP